MHRLAAHKRLTAAGIVTTAAVLWTAASSGQDVRPTPGPGPGYVTVRGTVEAIQEGDWKVSLPAGADVRVTNSPTVTLASPGFLKVGRRYSVIWPGGRTESIVVAQLGSGAWTRVETNEARRRWVNLDGAEAVEEF